MGQWAGGDGVEAWLQGLEDSHPFVRGGLHRVGSDDVDGLGNRIGLFGNSGGNFGIFRVDELHNFLCS